MAKYEDLETGEILSEEQFNALQGATEDLGGEFAPQIPSAPTPEVPRFTRFGTPTEVQPGQTSFLQRLRLGFGGEKAKAEQQRLEKEAGLKGRLDIGDIADVAGAALPFVGGILGGAGGTVAGTPVGGVAGAAIGASAGQAVRRAIGAGLGLREEEGEGFPVTAKEAVNMVGDVAKTGAFYYLGGQALKLVGKIPVVKKAGEAIFQKLPERFYSTFFKTTADDLAHQVKTGGVSKLQQTDPELFNTFVKEGLIKIGKTGTVEFNPTLARQALEKGLRGSYEKMAEISYVGQLKSEVAARNAVRGSKVLIDLGKDKTGYIKMLKDTINTFGKEGYGFLRGPAAEAKTVYSQLIKTKGNKIPAELALGLRRAIDGLRQNRSFRTSAVLGPKQAIFKASADKIRTKLASDVPGLKQIMGDYKFYIDAADSLIAEAARRGNQRIFSLFDAVVGGTSLSSLGLGGLGILTAARVVQTPYVLTLLGRVLQTAPKRLFRTAVPIAGELGKRLFTGGTEQEFSEETSNFPQ